MATTEHTINDALAARLRVTRSEWRSGNVLRSENTGTLKGSSERPDILIVEPGVSPVIIETEVFPATSVEQEALARLGKQLRTTGRTILSTVGVRLPVRLRELSGNALDKELSSAADLELALYTGSGADSASRWPRSGWIRGNVDDFSIMAQSAAVPPDVIDAAAEVLVTGVQEAAELLNELAESHAGALHKISERLHQADGLQTRRMAATILANALVFHGSLEGGSGKLADVHSTAELRSGPAGLSKQAVLDEWKKILEVNYWPIFDIARRILEVIPVAEARAVVDLLARTADQLLESRLMRSHDLTGAVFQRLIADRKFLAAYYTTPAAAALLVGLAVTPDKPLGGISWADSDQVADLRVADFACGTDTLLSTAYRRIGQLHELAGGDSEALHRRMMATALVGCDVLPAATHLTASMLAGAHPTVEYDQSSILTLAYGRQPDGAISLGSLDLLDPQGRLTILAVTATAVSGMGAKEQDAWSSLPHATFDLVLMNPPFTRPTGHEGKKIGVQNPMFAAFSANEDDQKLMSKMTQRLAKGTAWNGNAGEASLFLSLADRKLKTGGSLGLVMPLSLLSGDAWEDARSLIARNYSDLIMVTIAGADGAELSFSADTDMGECLVVGRKTGVPSERATFVVLNERPRFPMLGLSTARQIHEAISAHKLWRLEDGPVGGTPIRFGDDVVGQAVEAPLPIADEWRLARIADIALAQVAHQLSDAGRIWLPGMSEADVQEVPICPVSAIATIGPYHMDVSGKHPDGGVRGPFGIQNVVPGATPTYPVLWSHDAERERSIVFEAESEGLPIKSGKPAEQAMIRQKVESVWNAASHCHFNRDFRFNSQSTAMQFTPRKTVGGRAWLSLLLATKEQETALALWANTSLGLLTYWWHANKQQSGRGSIGKSALQSVPVLDVTRITSDRLEAASDLLNDFGNTPLLPLNEIHRDTARRELDARFMRDVLRLDESLAEHEGPLHLLRLKLSREPSIRGKKR